MIKTLTPIGNSLGIVLEKALLEAAEVGRDTRFRVQLFGRRFVLEPVDEEQAPPERATTAEVPAAGDPPSRPSELDMRKPANTVRVLDELVKRGLDDPRFRQMHHAEKYVNTIARHRAYCARPGAGDFAFDGTNMRTGQRFLACLEALKAGMSWEDAIAEALKRVPRP